VTNTLVDTNAEQAPTDRTEQAIWQKYPGRKTRDYGTVNLTNIEGENMARELATDLERLKEPTLVSGAPPVTHDCKPTHDRRVH